MPDDVPPLAEKKIVLYGRERYCPGVALARDLLTRYDIPYREIDISSNPEMAARVKAWTGYHSVPTLIIAPPGEDVPTDPVAPLPDDCPPGYNRGPLITEPNNRQLENWLHEHGFLKHPYRR